MIDSLHKAPTVEGCEKVCYPGEIEAATAIERAKSGIPVSNSLFAELQALGEQLKLDFPHK
jgi:LDH2 family malate/lactate/ureidoglycolate dehydrogenase